MQCERYYVEGLKTSNEICSFAYSHATASLASPSKRCDKPNFQCEANLKYSGCPVSVKLKCMDHLKY